MVLLSDRVTAPSTCSDLDLLRKFEPVVRFTKGEQFYPMKVEPYIRDSSLWEHHPDGHDELLVKQGELTLDKLVETRPAEFGSVRYLRFVEQLNLAETAQLLADQLLLRNRLENHFQTGLGRLARGGILPRLLDGLFSLSFLLRGKVSTATAAAAELDYHEITKEDKEFTYYGRVTRQDGWTILQYWFFFCFNSWRSGFHGVNDHESDWEMVSVYLYEENGYMVPEWAAYASHDFKGDDLRRRWDDCSELTIEAGHPVVYSGAGSHASYFRHGEYQAEVNPPLPGWISGLLRSWNKFWVDTLGQPAVSTFRIPFVDFARGDGLVVGPGQARNWSPVMIDESTPWVSQYRGLWGLFARDPISGENAPAGPMYNRDGSPRGSWYDPLGFAGLDKVPPPPQALLMITINCTEVAEKKKELEKRIPEKAGRLQSLGIRLKGMEGNPHLSRLHTALLKEIASLSAEVRTLRRENIENTALLQGLTRRMKGMKAGELEDVHSHIHRLAVPDLMGKTLRFDRAAETWAAVSLSLLLFIFAALIFFAPNYIGIGLVLIVLLFVVGESILRGAFIQTIGRITVILAMAGTLILFIHFWKWIIVTTLLIVGISLMYQRLREITG